MLLAKPAHMKTGKSKRFLEEKNLEERIAV